MPRQFYPGKGVEVLVNGVWLCGTITEPSQPGVQGGLRIWLDQLPPGRKTREVFAGSSSIKALNQPDRKVTLLDELRDTFHFAAPVRFEGKEGVVKRVPNDDLMVLVAFPVAAEEAPSPEPSRVVWHMNRQEVSCLELERIFPPRPKPIGLSLV